VICFHFSNFVSLGTSEHTQTSDIQPIIKQIRNKKQDGFQTNNPTVEWDYLF